MTRHVAKIAAVILVMTGAGTAAAQQVNRHDRSQPSPGEIAMATECRDTYLRMRELEKLLDANRNQAIRLDVKIKHSSQKLDELQRFFETRSKKSQENDEAYQAALKAKVEYETAAKSHNTIIEKQDKLAEKRISLSDEFFVVNPNYVTKCSGTIFKALSVILTCKDEKSEWCDLLK